jgi:glycosyltransferase involved in cell wall biosynthesis
MKNCIAYYLQRFSFFLIKNRATKIIVVNSLVKDALLGYGLDVNKIEVSSNAINIEYFNKIDTNITLAYDGVFIGRLSKVKGVFDLIEIWKKVNIKSYKYRLAIIGGGDTKIINDLNDIIRKNNLSSSVFVLGYIENEKAYSVLKSSKVFLFPSHEEGWGIVIAEAMACGLPVVSWDLPVFREVFLDHTFQIREGNTNEFASKVSDLLSDTQLRKKMSETGYDFIKQYSWAKIAEKEKRIVTV